MRNLIGLIRGQSVRFLVPALPELRNLTYKPKSYYENFKVAELTTESLRIIAGPLIYIPPLSTILGTGMVLE